MENILARRVVKKGQIEYKVKWLWYDKPSDNAWEPAENIANCQELIQVRASTQVSDSCVPTCALLTYEMLGDIARVWGQGVRGDSAARRSTSNRRQGCQRQR